MVSSVFRLFRTEIFFCLSFFYFFFFSFFFGLAPVVIWLILMVAFNPNHSSQPSNQKPAWRIRPHPVISIESGSNFDLKIIVYQIFGLWNQLFFMHQGEGRGIRGIRISFFKIIYPAPFFLEVGYRSDPISNRIRNSAIGQLLSYQRYYNAL